MKEIPLSVKLKILDIYMLVQVVFLFFLKAKST